MMTFLRSLGFAASLGLLGLAGFLAHTPWRVHGGRFITEYMLLAGVIALVGLLILWLSWRAA
jgi:membrane protein DedA with SNARE-associated domain